MKKEFIEAATKGHIIKSNGFLTECGRYEIDILVHEGKLYFFKAKNGKIVECINLSEQAESVV